MPPDKRDEFARKAEWFRFLAARGTLRSSGTLSDGSDRSGLDASIEDSPPAPKRSLKPFLTTLWLAGAAIYLISTVLFTNAINVLGDKNEQGPNSEVSRQIATPRDFASKEEPARVKPAVPPSSPAPYRRHAISPGQPPYESPDLIVPPSAKGEGHNTSPVFPTEQVSAPHASPEPELFEVREAASIRNGPSPTAVVIGTASPGAQLRIKARENNWIQFVDPTSGNTGWIETHLVTTPGSPQGGSNVAGHSRGAQPEFTAPLTEAGEEAGEEETERAIRNRKTAAITNVSATRDRAYAELHEDDDSSPIGVPDAMAS